LVRSTFLFHFPDRAPRKGPGYGAEHYINRFPRLARNPFVIPSRAANSGACNALRAAQFAPAGGAFGIAGRGLQAGLKLVGVAGQMV